jgi:hypothetical protein
MLENGSPPLIHGKITTSPANRITKGLPRGLFKATRSQNGKHPEQVPYSGYMGNVSCYAYTLSEIDGLLLKWARERVFFGALNF